MQSTLTEETALMLISYIARHCDVELPMNFWDQPPPEEVQLVRLEDEGIYKIIALEKKDES